MSIGKTLRELREESEMTLEYLAKKISLSKSYLSLIENDKRRVDIEVLKIIAQELKIPIYEILIRNEMEKKKLTKKEKSEILNIVGQIKKILKE